MDAAGLEYIRRDNCFTWLEHAAAKIRVHAEGLAAAVEDSRRLLAATKATMFSER
jgi:hypothetical protein